MTSTKQDKFKKLAEKRVTDTLKNFQLIGNLSNKMNYEYTDDEVRQIIETLQFEIEVLEEKFKEGVKDTVEFKFK